MAEIGNSSEELYIRFRNNIYLQNGSSGIINILNPDGSLNVKVKDIINNSKNKINKINMYDINNNNIGNKVRIIRNNRLLIKSPNRNLINNSKLNNI